MNEVVWCEYEKVGDSPNGEFFYRCRYCGDERSSRHPPELLHRRCKTERKRLSPGELRKELEREVFFFVDNGTATQTKEQITSLLDKCFGGCPLFEDGDCINFEGTCTRRRRWIERLLFNGCEKWKTCEIGKRK